MNVYTISSRDGTYIAKIKATNKTDACYVLYNAVFGGHPNLGTVLDISDSSVRYVLLGTDEGPNFFDNYVVEPILEG